MDALYTVYRQQCNVCIVLHFSCITWKARKTLRCALLQTIELNRKSTSFDIQDGSNLYKQQHPQKYNVKHLVVAARGSCNVCIIFIQKEKPSLSPKAYIHQSLYFFTPRKVQVGAGLLAYSALKTFLFGGQETATAENTPHDGSTFILSSNSSLQTQTRLWKLNTHGGSTYIGFWRHQTNNTHIICSLINK